MTGIAIFRESLEAAASDAKAWFYSVSTIKTRDVYFKKGQLGDEGKGAVYVYYNAHEEALYVGETSRPIKCRMHDKTSPHKDAEWWDSWQSVRFVQVHEQTDRITLELLLILSLEPKFNSKPSSRVIALMFE